MAASVSWTAQSIAAVIGAAIDQLEESQRASFRIALGEYMRFDPRTLARAISKSQEER